MSGFFQGANDVLDVRPIGHIGDVYRTSDYQSISASNADGQAAAVKTITVDTATNGATYTVTIDGIAVSYTADSSATKAEISAGLKAAIDVEPGHRVSVADDGTDTLTLTGNYPGVDFTLTVGALLSTALLSAAATASDTEPGRAVIFTGEADASSGNFPAKNPVEGDFTAQVKEITITTAAPATFVTILRVNGEEHRADLVSHNTNAATTANDIKTAFDAVAPANTVSVASASGVLTFTAEVAGLEFDVEIIAAGIGGDAEVTATTGPDRTTSLRRALLGLAVRRLDAEAASVGGDASLPAMGGIEVARRGRMVVERDTAETWTAGGDLYVGVASGTAGRLYSTAGAARVHIGGDAVTIDRNADNGLGLVRINVGA